MSNEKINVNDFFAEKMLTPTIRVILKSAEPTTLLHDYNKLLLCFSGIEHEYQLYLNEEEIFKLVDFLLGVKQALKEGKAPPENYDGMFISRLPTGGER